MLSVTLGLRADESIVQYSTEPAVFVFSVSRAPLREIYVVSSRGPCAKVTSIDLRQSFNLQLCQQCQSKHTVTCHSLFLVSKKMFFSIKLWFIPLKHDDNLSLNCKLYTTPKLKYKHNTWHNIIVTDGGYSSILDTKRWDSRSFSSIRLWKTKLSY